MRKSAWVVFDNGASIDLQSGAAYDSANNQIGRLTPVPLRVLRCIAESPTGISPKAIFDANWPGDDYSKNLVTTYVNTIRKKIAELCPEDEPEKFLSTETGAARSENLYIFTKHCMVIPAPDLPVYINLADLYAVLTGDYEIFQPNSFAWVSDHFDSVFPKSGANWSYLAKRVLFFTGDCFRDAEHKPTVPDRSLAEFFRYASADKLVLEKVFEFCLSPENAKTEKEDCDRMLKAWGKLENSIAVNLMHSYQASLYLQRRSNMIPLSMKDIDIVGTPYEGIEKDKWFNKLKETLAEHILQTCGTYLHSLGRETSLDRAVQKRNPDVVYSYITAIVLICFYMANTGPACPGSLLKKKERYRKALEACIQEKEKLPPADSPSKQYTDYLSNKPEEAYAALEELIDCLREKGLLGSFSQEQLFVLFKSVLNSKNITPENGGPTLDLSLTPDK